MIPWMIILAAAAAIAPAQTLTISSAGTGCISADGTVRDCSGARATVRKPDPGYELLAEGRNWMASASADYQTIIIDTSMELCEHSCSRPSMLLDSLKKTEGVNSAGCERYRCWLSLAKYWQDRESSRRVALQAVDTLGPDFISTSVPFSRNVLTAR